MRHRPGVPWWGARFRFEDVMAVTVPGWPDSYAGGMHSGKQGASPADLGYAIDPDGVDGYTVPIAALRTTEGVAERLEGDVQTDPILVIDPFGRHVRTVVRL